MNINELVNKLTPEQYSVLVRAIELGKWPDGRCLLSDEREHAMRVMIAYDARNKTEEERVGYIYNPKKKEVCLNDTKNLISKS